MAANLEELVSNIRQKYLSGASGVSELIKPSFDILIRNAVHLDNVLETFAVEEHSVAVMACLMAKLQTLGASPSRENVEKLLSQLSDFLTNCNEAEIRLRGARENFGELCHYLTQILVAHNCAIRGIALLSRAIKKLQSTPDELTVIHADLCQLCLLAKCLKPALPFLDVDISTLCSTGSGINKAFDSKQFLLYYFYGGMIYTALKRFDEAQYMFEIVITVPARAVSHIMLEAFKKHVLVSLILHGKLSTLPKFTSQVVGRFIKPLSLPYTELANACQANNSEAARAILTKHEALFSRDKNLGLVRQVLANQYKNNIQRLTKTFLTLSLSDVAARVKLSGIETAELHIRNMIEDGEIFATMNQKDGMVVFHDDPEKYNSPEMLKKLEDEVSACIALDRKIQAMEEEITLNPVFVQKCSCQDDEAKGQMNPFSM